VGLLKKQMVSVSASFLTVQQATMFASSRAEQVMN
jgi:hypothetical protein